MNEILTAQALRCLMSICDSWKSDDEISIEDMTNHLEMVNKLIDGEINYAQFLKSTGLKENKRSR